MSDQQVSSSMNQGLGRPLRAARRLGVWVKGGLACASEKSMSYEERAYTRGRQDL